LDGVGEFEIKLTGFWAHTDENTTYIVDGVPRVVAAKVEYAFPKAPMRMDAKETLAKRDKNRNVEERVWGRLM
jgi:hypothetical protein